MYAFGTARGTERSHAAAASAVAKVSSSRSRTQVGRPAVEARSEAESSM